MKDRPAEYRPKVPRDVRLRLYREAGSKCANPGCPNRLVQLHHIDEWAVYQTHNEKHMIALCATCHDHCHRGEIRLNEAALRSWKTARRNPSNTGYLYIEPAEPPRVLMGCCYWRRTDGDGATVFKLSDRNNVSFRVLPGGVILVSAILSNPAGEVIARIQDNRLEHVRNPDVQFDFRPGRARISVPATSDYLQMAMVESYQSSRPSLVVGGRIAVLDVTVLDLGVVQFEGVWTEADHAIISHNDYLSIWLPSGGFAHWRGFGKVRGDKDLDNLPIIQLDGPIDESVLGAISRLEGI